MSVLRNVLFNGLRQMTCLVIPKYPAVFGSRHVANDSTLNPEGTVESVENVDAEVDTEEVKEKNLQDMSFVDMLEPGVYFPTEDVYETTYDGIKYEDLSYVKMVFTRTNVKVAALSSDGQTLYSRKSCGLLGFKNAEKRSTVAAQTTGYQLGIDMARHNVFHTRVEMRGQTMSRLPALMGLQQAGINVVSVSDKTSHSFYNKPRKAKHKYYKFGRI